MVSICFQDFGKPSNDPSVHKFILQTDYMQVALTNYGASLINLHCPDRDGQKDDILLGFDTLQGYIDNRYFGSTIGRCANRIARGQFSLDGKSYKLAQNNGGNHLHGGVDGFDRKVWAWQLLSDGVQFEICSDDGDEGYLGELHVTVTYTVPKPNELNIDFKAVPRGEKATIVNLTNHAFLNLAGQKSALDVLDHVLQLKCEKYLPHHDGIPSGDVVDVPPPFDFFSTPKLIGKDIEKVDGGYDHNYCLNNLHSYFARVEHPQSGRILEMETNQPGVQFYSGNFLNCVGKNGNQYNARSGFCLEPQNYPNAVNESSFPSPIVNVGEVYERFIKWKLSTN